ncbi:MAG: hypothetical protein KGO52_00270 [Nitrospirota bacterium]|nr:hypothetical protein [Nitrospirota bacterium]
MALYVNTNIASINSQRNLGISENSLNTALERLSSGLRINHAADDAAGLAISTKLDAQSAGLQQASRNANDAISLAQVAEGSLNTSLNIVQRLRALAVQAASDSNTSSDRATLNQEATQLTQELTRLANATQFNGGNLLDGSFTGKLFQVGSNANQTLSFSLADARATALGKYTSQSVTIGSGAAQGVAGSGQLTAGVFTVNGTNVAVTSDSSDQVSVLTVGGSAVSIAGTAGVNTASLGDVVSAASLTVNINGVSIGVSKLAVGSVGSYTSVGSLATDIVSAINAQNITNVTARVVNSSYVVLEAAKGTNLAITVSAGAIGASAVNVAGIFGLAAGFFGSGATAVTTYNGQSSAIAKAASVNAVSSTTGVNAVVTSTSVAFSNAVGAGSLNSGDLIINGTNIGAVTVTANDSSGALVAAINAQTATTGVSAAVSSGKLTLTATDGRNISIEAASNNANGVNVQTTILGNSGNLTFTGVDAIARGGLTLNSTSNITIGGTTTDFGSLTPTTYVATGNLSTLDLTTQTGATNAITQLDSAINSLNSARSTIGAVQSRLQNVISALDTASQNQTAASARIKDADFALETANFTKAQILVQAGTAITAQANSSANVALQLLSGK